MKSITLIFLILVNIFTFGQEIKIPDNFTEIPVPISYSQEWYLNNHKSESYSLKKQNEKLIIEEKEKGNKVDLEIEAGKIIGINNGEWGGGLYFRTKKLQKKPVEIKPGNIVDIIKFKNKIYFTQGLVHMGINNGALYELINQKNSFTYFKMAELGDAPAAITSFENKIFIISHKNFYEINTNENNKITKIFENQFWKGLYPNSIVAFDERNIFAGMRSGILKINLIDKTIKFYRKNEILK